MLAAVLFATAAAVALPVAHVVEDARTEQLVVVPGGAGPEALFIVDDERAHTSELRAVRVDPGQRMWTASRVLVRGAAIGRFDVDVDAGVVLVAVVGETPGVALVPLRPAAAQTTTPTRPGFVAVPGVRDVIACGGRRIATAYDNGKLAAYDLTSVAVGARLDRPPPPPASSPAALLTARAEPVSLACSERTLAAASARELTVFDGKAATRVPWPRDDRDWVRGVFALPGGDLVVWSHHTLQVIDRSGTRKASLGGSYGSVQVVRTARGLRLLTNVASWSLPLLDDRRALDGAGSLAAAVDEDHAVALVRSGLRARVPLPPTTTATLNDPRSIARRADGKRFAVGEKNGAVVVLERQRPGESWRAVTTINDHVGDVHGLAYLAAGVAGTPSDALVTVGADGFVHVYAEPKLARVRTIPLGVRGDSVAFDVVRGRVAVADTEAIAIVDVKAGTARLIGPLPREDYGSLRAGAFSPDGTQLAFLDDVGRVRVYALGDGREDRRIAGRHTFVAYDARGRLVRATRDDVFVDGERTPSTVDADRATLDPATGELWLSAWSGTFGRLGQPPRNAPWHVAGLVLDGNRVVTIGPDEQVSSWPRQGSGAPRAVFGVRRTRVEALAFADDELAVAFEGGQVLIAASDGRTRALRPARCRLAAGDELDLTPRRLTVRKSGDAPTQAVLVAATTRGELSWNLVTGARTCPPELGLDGFDIEVAGFTAEGRAVLIAGTDGVIVTGADHKRLKGGGREDADVDAAVVTGEGTQRMVVYTDDEGVHAVRIADGVEVAHTRGADVAALPGGRVLLGRWPLDGPGGPDEAPTAIAVWRPGAGAPNVVTRTHTWTNDLVTAPNGAHFIHSVDGEVWVRSTGTGAVRAVIDAGVDNPVLEAFAFAPDSSRFAVARAGALGVYDLDGQLLWSVDPRPR